MIENDSFEESNISQEKPKFFKDKKELLNSSQIQADKQDKVNKQDQQGPAAEKGPAEQVLSGSSLTALAARIKAIPEEGRSDSFKALKYALEKNGDALSDIEANGADPDGEAYAEFMEIYQAVSQYMTSHATSTSSKSVEVYRTVLAIRNTLDDMAKAHLQGDSIGNLSDVEYQDRELKHAKENVGRLLKYYIKYSMRVDADLIDSGEKKLERKWDALKSCERDIRVYLADKLSRCQGRISGLKGMDAFLYQEYTSVKTQMLYKNRIAPEKDKVSADGDEHLTGRQLAAISRIDTWVIRNFRNGGYMAVFGSASDRTDIVGKLLSMSKRKRLYIYYLIEKRERINPTADGMISSQLYEPDLAAFKDKMIANMAKFYKRFSGGYIYWNKLAEAMGIADQLQPMFDNVSLLYSEKEKKEVKNNNEIVPEEEDRKQLQEILQLSMRAMMLCKENDDDKTDPQTKADNEKEIMSLGMLIGEKLQEQKAKASSSRDDVRQFTSNIEGKTVAVGTVIKKTLEEKRVQSWTSLKSESVAKLAKYYNPVLSGISAFSAVAGGIFAILSLKDNAGSMNWIDITASGTSLLIGGFKATKATTSVIQSLGATSSATKAITSATGTYITAGADTAVAVMNTASYIRSSRNRIKASKLASALMKKSVGDKDEKRFTKGMLELNRKLGRKQKTGTFGSLGVAAMSSTSVVLLSLSVVTIGISAIAGAIGLGIGAALSAFESKDARSMKNVLFDSFYQTDKELEKEKKRWEINNPGKELSDKQLKQMKEQLRGRIAAAEGFYSPRHAAKAVAAKFADILLEGANRQDEKSGMYVSFIKGLGLAYKYNSDERKSVPKASDIAKKLCG